MSNTNGDSTGDIIIEHKPAGSSEWQELARFEGNRSELEVSTATISVPTTKIHPIGETFRVVSTTLYGTSSTSGEIAGPDFADYNGDGKVDATDVKYYVKCVLGIISGSFTVDISDITKIIEKAISRN